MEAFRELQAAVRQARGEAAEKRLVVEAAGGLPEVIQGRLDDRRVVRTYLWRKGRLGPVALVTGPDVEPTLYPLVEHRPGDPLGDVYLPAKGRKPALTSRAPEPLRGNPYAVTGKVRTDAEGEQYVEWRPVMPDGSRPRVRLPVADAAVTATQRAEGAIASARGDVRKGTRKLVAKKRRRRTTVAAAQGPIVKPIFDAAGREYSVTYRVVATATSGKGPVVPSNDPKTMRPERGYPVAFQARSLEGASETAKIDEIARNLDPTRLLVEHGDPTLGPPVVWPDDRKLYVLGGNGRTIALLKAPKARYDAYVEEGRKRWPSLWPTRSAGKGKRWMLVREVANADGSRMTEQQAVTLAGASQEATSAAESPIGRALSTVRGLGISSVAELPSFTWGGIVTSDTVADFQRENTTFIQALLDRLDRAQAKRVEGDPALLADLVNAVMVGFLPREVQRQGFASEKDERALLASMPILVTLQQGIDRGEIEPKWGLLPRLDAARQFAVMVRNRSVKQAITMVERAAQQVQLGEGTEHEVGTLFDDLDPLAVAFAILLKRAGKGLDPAVTIKRDLGDGYKRPAREPGEPDREPRYLQAALDEGDSRNQMGFGAAFGASAEVSPADTLAGLQGVKLPEKTRRRANPASSEWEVITLPRTNPAGEEDALAGDGVGVQLALFSPRVLKDLVVEHFASGSNHAGEIRGFAALRKPVGAAVATIAFPGRKRKEPTVDYLARGGQPRWAPLCTSACEQALIETARKGVPIFMDSGAFSEVEFGARGPVTVLPIEDAEWQKRLALYDRLVDGAGKHARLVNVVAPDKVGFQGETLRRLTRYAPRVRELAAKGATILVPLQKGDLDLSAFHDAVTEALGFSGWVPAIPMKKAATTPKELESYLSEKRPARVHLLGVGPRSRIAPEVAAAALDASPSTRVQMDSVLLRAVVGRGKGPGGADKPLTVAQDAAREEVSQHRFSGYPREFRDAQGFGLPDYTDEIGTPSSWMTEAGLRRIAKELKLDRASTRLLVSDPDEAFQREIESTYSYRWPDGKRLDEDAWKAADEAQQKAWIAERGKPSAVRVVSLVPASHGDPDGKFWNDPIVEQIVDKEWSKLAHRDETAAVKRLAVERTFRQIGEGPTTTLTRNPDTDPARDPVTGLRRPALVEGDLPPMLRLDAWPHTDTGRWLVTRAVYTGRTVTDPGWGDIHTRRSVPDHGVFTITVPEGALVVETSVRGGYKASSLNGRKIGKREAARLVGPREAKANPYASTLPDEALHYLVRLGDRGEQTHAEPYPRGIRYLQRHGLASRIGCVDAAETLYGRETCSFALTAQGKRLLRNLRVSHEQEAARRQGALFNPDEGVSLERRLNRGDGGAQGSLFAPMEPPVPAHLKVPADPLAQEYASLYERFGHLAAPKQGERGYRPEPRPQNVDAWGGSSPYEVANRMIDNAIRYMEEPEFAWAWAWEVGDMGDQFYDEDWWGDPENAPDWTLDELVAPPRLDGKGQPLTADQRTALAIEAVEYAMEADPMRWRGDREALLDEGKSRKGPSRPRYAQRRGGYGELPVWAVKAALGDELARQTPGYSLKLRLAPVTKEEAATFIHRHHSALPYLNPKGLMYALGLYRGERLVAVATAGSPTGKWSRRDPRQIVELTRVASDGSVKGAASKLVARLLDLLPVSGRGSPDDPKLFITYQLATEDGTTYKALRDKGLRPVAYRPGTSRSGSRKAASGDALGHVPKIRWECCAEPPADRAKWDLIEPEPQTGLFQRQNPGGWLPLDVVEAAVVEAERRGVSERARSPGQFVEQYRAAGGDPERLDPAWRRKRDGFVARHMAQAEAGEEPLFSPDGKPTRRHLALAVWGYSPIPDALVDALFGPIQNPQAQLGLFDAIRAPGAAQADLITVAQEASAWSMPDTTTPPQSVELFAGGGLFALAQRVEGVIAQHHCELDAAAVATIRHNLDEGVITCDVREYQPRRPPGGLDILTGGPPCQPWSQGGARRGVEDERNLWPRVLEIVRDLKPRVVLMENVAGILYKKHAEFVQGWWERMGALGYDGAIWSLLAADYGSAQLRPRVWFVAWPKGAPWGAALGEGPPPRYGDPRTAAADGLIPWVRAFDRSTDGCCGGFGYWSCVNLMDLDGACKGCDQGSNYSPAPNDDAEEELSKAQRAYFKTADVLYQHPPIDTGGAFVRDTIYGRKRTGPYLAPTLPKGFSKRTRGADYTVVGTRPGALLDFQSFKGSACPIDEYLSALRPLSVREIAKLQSVPQWYEFHGSEVEQQNQVGNGIDVCMGRAVIQHVMRALGYPSPYPGSIAAQGYGQGLWPMDRHNACLEYRQGGEEWLSHEAIPAAAESGYGKWDERALRLEQEAGVRDVPRKEYAESYADYHDPEDMIGDGDYDYHSWLDNGWVPIKLIFARETFAAPKDAQAWARTWGYAAEPFDVEGDSIAIQLPREPYRAGSVDVVEIDDGVRLMLAERR